MVEPIERAKNRAQELLAGLDAALEAGQIGEDEWYRRVAAVITPAYLVAGNPRGQSGYLGDAARWERARGLIADALDRDGAFLDVGCASGLLMEDIERWGRERGFAIESHGLDIAPELAALARSQVPRFAERIHVGNAIDWTPPRRYDFVRTGLEYVPTRRQRDLVERLLRDVVSPVGRLIIGTFNEERDATRVGPSQEEVVRSWGFEPAGRRERAHGHDERLVYRVFWIDAPGRR